MGDGASYIVLRRPFDNDPDREEEPRWEKVGFASSRAEGIELASYPTDEDGEPLKIGRGDLIFSLPIDSLNPLLMQDAADSDLFVVDKSGYASTVGEPPPCGRQGCCRTWLAAWEGQDADASKMLREACTLVSDQHLILASSDAAKEGLVALSAADRVKPAALIDAAVGWARGSVSTRQLREATRLVEVMRDKANREGLGVEYWAYDAAINAATCHMAKNRAAEAAESAAVCLPAHRDVSLRGMAPLVRRWIQLSVVLLGRLGERLPLPQEER
jgi:hypothetical protein